MPGPLWTCAPLTIELRVQEQLARADRLFPVGCRVTATAFTLAHDQCECRSERHIFRTPVLTVRAPAKGGATQCYLPGPVPRLTVRHMCTEAEVFLECALPAPPA